MCAICAVWLGGAVVPCAPGARVDAIRSCAAPCLLRGLTSDLKEFFGGSCEIVRDRAGSCRIVQDLVQDLVRDRALPNARRTRDTASHTHTGGCPQFNVPSPSLINVRAFDKFDG
eukprot:5026555-Prymnesium_polylepis.1